MIRSSKDWLFRGVLAAVLIAPAISPAYADQDPKPAAPQPAPAPAPPADTAGKFTITGLLDGYYMYNMNHPPVGTLAGGRAFDVKNDSFSLSLAEVNVTRSAGKGVPVGFTATFTVGKTADIVHATEPGGPNTYKYLQQLYGTYATSTKVPITIDFGKFVTWLGTEVIESSSNDNYSRSLLFTYAIPFYHMGLRLTAPIIPDKVTAGLYLVNGWNDVEDDNGGKTLGASLTYTPTKTISVAFNYIGGDEFTAAGIVNPAFVPGNPNTPPFLNLNVQLGELVASWNLTAKLKIAANVDYASAAKPGKFGGNWSGEAIYGRYQIGKEAAIAVRGEHFEDNAGLRTGIAQNLNEVTATLEYAWKSSLLSRLEFRHDHAGTAFFPSGGGFNKNQDTLTLAQVIKF